MSTPETGKARILVVEDDGDVLRLLSAVLKEEGDVILAADGAEALEYLKRGPLPDLVVTDVMMPRMDGLTLVNEMKAESSMNKIPVIMLTAKDAPGDIISGINAGVRQYVTKPFKKDDLIARVRRALKRA